MNKLIFVILITIASVPAFAFMHHGPGVTLTQEFGMDILDTTPDSTFADNVTYSKAAGSDYMLLSLGWNQIEATTPSDCTTPGTYTDPYGGALETFNTYLPANGLKLSLSILPVSTTINFLPSNLTSTPFDNSLLICRFQLMLAQVAAWTPNITFISIQVGNELDAYGSAVNASFWSQYYTFVASVVPTVHSLFPGSKVSITGTLYGATGNSSNVIAQAGLEALWTACDMIDVTYYPLNTDYSVKSPSVVNGDIGGLVSLYTSKPIYFNEIGYPSGTVGGGSEALQETFYQNVVLTWNQYRSNILHMAFVRLNDYSYAAAQAEAANYGLGSNANFINYLQTLGLVNYDGANKAAFTYLSGLPK